MACARVTGVSWGLPQISKLLLEHGTSGHFKTGLLKRLGTTPVQNIPLRWATFVLYLAVLALRICAESTAVHGIQARLGALRSSGAPVGSGLAVWGSAIGQLLGLLRTQKSGFLKTRARGVGF